MLTYGNYGDNSGDSHEPEKKVVFEPTKGVVYDLIDSYKTNDIGHICYSPGWCLSVYRLGKPVSYSRKKMGSFSDASDVVTGAFERKTEPLIISDDCVGLSINGQKTSHTKVLEAILKPGLNYLSSNNILPGDWILAWAHSDIEDTNRIIKQIKAGEACNDFKDGLKFVGRVHSIRKTVQVDNSFKKNVLFKLQCIGFDELNTSIFYDMALGSEQAMNAGNPGSQSWANFMAQLSPDLISLAASSFSQAGSIKDNISHLIASIVDIIIGKGISKTIANSALTAAQQNAGGGVVEGKINPNGRQIEGPLYSRAKESPFAYILPVSVAKTLGREVYEKSKQNVFSYADILETLIGVQQFSQPLDGDLSKGFSPILDMSVCNYNSSHKFCRSVLRGSVLPTELTFINKPLWSLLDQIRNPSLNEMYTALKVNAEGKILPTLVVRQIPFSTDSLREYEGFPLTRFLSMPRWKVDPVMIRSLDVGRSNATRFNMVHVYGNASVYENADLFSITKQQAFNPPIVDFLDVARNGLKPYMQTVSVALPDLYRMNSANSNGDQPDSNPSVWMSAIADWTIGSHLTLNGTISCSGIQDPIAEGDNIEFEGIAYHIEAVSLSCSMDNEGHKTFMTTLSLSNGMPIDQDTNYKDHFPRYPGFGKNVEISAPVSFENSAWVWDNAKDLTQSEAARSNIGGDDAVSNGQDPGRTIDRQKR